MVERAAFSESLERVLVGYRTVELFAFKAMAYSPRLLVPSSASHNVLGANFDYSRLPTVQYLTKADISLGGHVVSCGGLLCGTKYAVEEITGIEFSYTLLHLSTG